jgi:hypothetical protein
MKFLLVLVPVAILAASALAVADAGTEAKRAICHRTSAKTPYVRLTVSAAALRKHAKHAGDIIPAPRGGCPRSVLSPIAGGQVFRITLTGEAETPAGDPVATGVAILRMRAGQGQVCYRLSVTNLTPAIAAHIHRAPAGASGNVVVPLQTPNAAGQARGCSAATRSLVATMLAKPANFYVNVHTKEFPGGAVRGQLVGSSASSLGRSFALTLKGTTEPNASGTAVIRIRRDDGLVCYRLHVENVTLPTVGAHIHKGAAGVSGPVVVPFTPPGADGNSSGCTQSQTALIDDIIANPDGYYVNVHTKEHPGGAIRSQLG